MDADIKWLVGDIRIGVTGFRNGLPWEIGVTIGVCMDGTAELQRIDKKLTISGWKAIGRCLARFGFTRYRYERKRVGEISYWHEKSLERFHRELQKEVIERLGKGPLAYPGHLPCGCYRCSTHCPDLGRSKPV